MAILCIMLMAAGCGTDQAEKAKQEGLVRGACQDNLRTIDSAVMQYSASNMGSYPRSIDQLVPTYLREAPECMTGGPYTLSKTTPPRAVCPNGHTY
jgi:hypothetical protein